MKTRQDHVGRDIHVCIKHVDTYTYTHTYIYTHIYTCIPYVYKNAWENEDAARPYGA